MKFEDGTDRPQRRTQGIECQELDDELLVTDVAADRAHFLNASMAAVWKLCDGTRSADQIAKHLAEIFAEIFDGPPADDLERVVREALETLAGLNLLRGATDRESPAP